MTGKVTERHLVRQRNTILADAAGVQAQINAARRRRRLLCHHCGKRSTVGKTTYIQPYWYQGPYGCTGGGDWHMSEEGRFVCLHCGWENRFWPKSKYGGSDNRGWICDLRDYFAKVVEVYGDGHGRERTKDWNCRARPKWCN